MSIHNPGKLTTEDLLDTRLRTLPADLHPWWGATRAGRAWATADATGQRTPARLRYPLSMSYVDILGGGLLGAGVGAFTAGVTGAKPERTAAAGALIGALLGGGTNVYLRRKGMRDIEEGASAVKNLPRLPQYGALKSAILPYAGPHRLGYSEVMEDVAYGDVDPRKARHATYGGGVLTNLALAAAAPPLAPLVNVGVGYGANTVAQDRSNKLHRLLPLR